MRPPKTALAFAPAVISNFFAIHDGGLSSSPPDLSMVGATGGGFTLSRGVYTHAWMVPSHARAVFVAVNGDAGYQADTTRKAVELLLDAARQPPLRVELVQTVEVPIGAGFGSSSASALSAVMAVAAALRLPLGKAQVASFAHQADILCGTGLGTVSSTYDFSGAGVVVSPGGPGVAKVMHVGVPTGVRLVTATLSPKATKSVLSSKGMREKVNRLGAVALERASDLKFESMLAAGQEFAEDLGLMTRDVKRLVSTALHEGAVGASQNMVGDAVHAAVRDEDVETVVLALRERSRAALMDSFRIGGRTATLLTE